MKNIHILPTDQPSRLFKFANELHLDTIPKDYYKKYNIYITSDEEIKGGDWFLDITDNTLWKNQVNEGMSKTLFPECKKIILTTDQDLINDGVQSIDDEFLEWFVKNPTCEFVEVKKQEVILGNYDAKGLKKIYDDTYKIIIPQKEPKHIPYTGKVWEPPKQSTLEEAAEKHYLNCVPSDRHSFIAGAKWMEKRMFSKEEVNEIISAIWISCEDNEGETFTEVRKRILEQFKKK